MLHSYCVGVALMLHSYFINVAFILCWCCIQFGLGLVKGSTVFQVRVRVRVRHACRILHNACIQRRKRMSNMSDSVAFVVHPSLSNVQSQMPNRNFVIASTTLATITFCFHNSAVSFFIINKIIDMLQQQEAFHFGYTNLGLHVQLQISKA